MKSGSEDRKPIRDGYIIENLFLVVMCILLSLIIGVVSGKLVGFGLSKVLERNR